MVEVFDVIYMAISVSIIFCSVLLSILDFSTLQNIYVYLLVIELLATTITLAVRYLKELLDGVRHYD